MADKGRSVGGGNLLKKHPSSPSCPGQRLDVDREGVSSSTDVFTSTKRSHPSTQRGKMRDDVSKPAESAILEPSVLEACTALPGPSLRGGREATKPTVELRHQGSERRRLGSLKKGETYERRIVKERKLSGPEAAAQTRRRFREDGGETGKAAATSLSNLRSALEPKLCLRNCESERQGAGLLRDREGKQRLASRDQRSFRSETLYAPVSCLEFARHGAFLPDSSRNKHNALRGFRHLRDTDCHRSDEHRTDPTKRKTLIPRQHSDVATTAFLKSKAVEPFQPSSHTHESSPAKNPHSSCGLPPRPGIQYCCDGRGGADSLADNFERALSSWNEELREAFTVKSRSLPIERRLIDCGTQTFVSFRNDISPDDINGQKKSDQTRPPKALLGAIRKTVFSTLENFNQKRFQRSKAKPKESLNPSAVTEDPKTQNENTSARRCQKHNKVTRSADESRRPHPNPTTHGVQRCLDENTSMRRDSKASLSRKPTPVQERSLPAAGCSRHDCDRVPGTSGFTDTGCLCKTPAVKSERNISENPDATSCLLCKQDGSRRFRQKQVRKKAEPQKRRPLRRNASSTQAESTRQLLAFSSKEPFLVPPETCDPLHQIFGVLVVFGVLVTLSFLVPGKFTHRDFDIADRICRSRSCSRAASSTAVDVRISRFMDTRADPCQDFYRFSCGRYDKEALLGLDDLYMDQAKRLTLDTRTQLHNLLLDPPRQPDVDAVKRAKLFYQACWRQTLSNDSESLAEIQEYLAGELAECSQSAFGQEAKLECILGKLALHGIDLVFDVSVDVDPHLTRKKALFLSPPKWTSLDDLDLNTALQSRDPEVVAFANEIRSKASNFHSPGTKSTANSYEKLTLKSLSNAYPHFDWIEFVSSFAKPSGTEVGETEIVILQPPIYFERVMPLLTQTPPSLLFRFVSDMVEFLSPSHPLNRRGCLAETETLFQWAVARLYIDNYIEPMLKRRVEAMSERVRNSSKDLVKETAWLPPNAKAALRRRLSQVGVRVAYPDSVLNEERLDDFYKEFNVASNKHHLNSLRAGKALQEAKLRTLRQPVVPGDFWPTTAGPPFGVDAVYVKNLDLVFLPAALLHAPLVDLGQPDSLNYGSLGSVIGHELAHGFSEGFPLDGASFGDVEVKFGRRLKCLGEQLSNVSSLEGRSGSVLLEEILADIGGLKASFRALQQATRDAGERKMVVDGLPYTADQLFFISFAQLHCRKHAPRMGGMLGQLQGHPPGETRVRMAVQNSEEFSRVFSCPRGSEMNKEQRCGLWRGG